MYWYYGHMAHIPEIKLMLCYVNELAARISEIDNTEKPVFEITNSYMEEIAYYA